MCFYFARGRCDRGVTCDAHYSIKTLTKKNFAEAM